MSWVVLSKKNSHLFGCEESVLSIKVIPQSFTKPWCSSLRKCWWKTIWWCTRLCFPSQNRAYILYSTCFTRKQVDNTFTVTIKFLFYFVTLLCNKTLEDVCIVNIKASLTFTFVTTRWSTFTWKRAYIRPNQILSKTKTCANRNKRRRCKYILNLFLSI